MAPATDALQVVLVSADGRALRTVSPNSQYLWGSVEWSPDASRIAYIMATGPFGQLPDIFVTELGRDVVTRVTTGAITRGEEVVGEPQGVARDGSFAVFVRHAERYLVHPRDVPASHPVGWHSTHDPRDG